MASLTTPMSDLPGLQTPEQGLIELRNLAEKRENDLKIEAFKVFAPTQPDFLISNQHWKLLASGISLDTDHSTEINWLKDTYSGYEVYGFVFCVAFRITHDNQKKAYFRVRNILKKIGDDTCDLIVDTDNIAYVDVEKAIDKPSENCLIFLSEYDTPDRANLKKVIDDEVYTTKKRLAAAKRSAQLARTPRGFIKVEGVNEKQTIIIKNEGSIFGKNRIWEQILNNTYKGKDSRISFTWNGLDKTIGLDFKINAQLATKIDCPDPRICHP